MSRTFVRELALSLAFTLVLLGIAEVLVRLADWPRLSALIVVLISGHLIKGLVQLFLSRRSDDRDAPSVRRPVPE